MPQLASAFSRDANGVPITTDGIITKTSKALIGNGATVSVPIFGITEVVECRAIWGIVTTTLGTNQTACFWRLNDGSNQSQITLATGTTISAAPAGSSLTKRQSTGTALTYSNAVASVVQESITAEFNYHAPFVLHQMTGGVATNIEFVYTTTDTPTSGVIQFFLRWLPMSSNGSVSAL